MAAADLSDVLPTITVPTLLLWGEQDARSTQTVARQFEQAIPGSRLESSPAPATSPTWSSRRPSRPPCATG